MSSSQPLDPWLGRLVGDRQRYRLEKRVGRGGMGDVYLATDTLLGQPVALKLLNNRLATGELRRRFEREVAVCAALRSSHIVQVSDYGITAEGYPFYVMEFLHGQTLGQLLRQEGYLSVERTVNIITQVCSGLYPAHRGINLRLNGATRSEPVKVIHRDLKPDNIFLVPTSLGEFVKVLDFGIAKLHSTQASETNFTNVFMGTYQYASPEQLEGEKNLDERADIYSLGMILYEMLSGTSPFNPDDPNQGERQLSGVGWAIAHLTKSPRSLREQPGCEELSPELEQVVMRCLEKRPERRFVSVVELSQALHAAVPGGSQLRLVIPPAIESGIESGIEPLPPPAATVKNLLPNTPATPNSVIQAAPTHVAACETAVAPKFKFLRPRFQRSVLLTTVGIIGVLALIIYWLRSFPFLPPTSEQPALQEQIESPPLAKPTEVDSFSGHTDTVWAVAASPDGKTIVSGGYDRTIRFWSRTGQLLQTLYGHSDAVRSVVLSADGKTLVSSSGDRTIRLWDARTGKLRRTLRGHSGPIWSVATSPNGKTLASGSYDGTIKIWDTQSGKLRRSLPEHYDSIWSVALSPDGQTLVSGSYDGTVKIWQLQTGALRRTLNGHTDGVRSVAISADGQTIASASWDKTVKVWNRDGALRYTLPGHKDRVLAVAIDPSARTLASGSADRTIKLWDLQTGALRHTLAGHQDWVVALAFAPPSAQTKSAQPTLISGSKDKTIKLWQ